MTLRWIFLRWVSVFSHLVDKEFRDVLPIGWFPVVTIAFFQPFPGFSEFGPRLHLCLALCRCKCLVISRSTTCSDNVGWPGSVYLVESLLVKHLLVAARPSGDYNCRLRVVFDRVCIQLHRLSWPMPSCVILVCIFFTDVLGVESSYLIQHTPPPAGTVFYQVSFLLIKLIIDVLLAL